MIVTACMVLMLVLMAFAWVVAINECKLREEMEEELWRLRWEHACRKHPALRNGGPQWWQDMNV